MDDNALLAREWQTLQDNHEQYETNALLIKLGALALAMAGLAAAVAPPWIGLAALLCWLQEGIVKTWQARLGERLLQVEAQLRQEHAQRSVMQLHSQWAAARPRGPALLAGYVASALRPTVAFPYLPVVIVAGLAWLLR